MSAMYVMRFSYGLGFTYVLLNLGTQVALSGKLHWAQSEREMPVLLRFRDNYVGETGFNWAATDHEIRAATLSVSIPREYLLHSSSQIVIDSTK